MSASPADQVAQRRTDAAGDLDENKQALAAAGTALAAAESAHEAVLADLVALQNFIAKGLRPQEGVGPHLMLLLTEARGAVDESGRRRGTARALVRTLTERCKRLEDDIGQMDRIVEAERVVDFPTIAPASKRKPPRIVEYDTIEQVRT